MTKTFLIFFFLFGAIHVCVAQDSSEESEAPELSLWRGGSASLDFYLGPHFLNGGIQSRTGGVISPRIEKDAFLVNSNPAMLGNLKKVDVRFNSRIGVGSNQVQPFYDLNGELNDMIATETENIFNNPDNFNQTENSRITPTNLTSLNAGLPSTLESFSIAYPISENFSLSVSYTNPVLMDMQLRLNGLSAKMAQEEGTDDVSIRFDVLMNIAAYSSFKTQMSVATAGFGARVLNSNNHELFLGGSVHRFYAENERVINTDLSGMVVVGYADERFFNNQLDPNLNRDNGETNELFFRAKGTFTGYEYGYRTGMYYQYKKRFGFSALYVNNPRMELTDPLAYSAAYLPVFVLGDDILSGDIEVVLEDLEANKPNLTTQRDISNLVEPATIQIPSYLMFGADIPMNNHTLALNYRHYLTDLEMGIGSDVFGKRNAKGVGMALDFNHTSNFRNFGWLLIPVRLALLDIDGLIFQAFKKNSGYRNPHITFGASVMLGDGFAEGGASDFKDVMDLPTPLGLNLGRSYQVFDGVNIGFNLISYPNIAFSYSLGLSF